MKIYIVNACAKEYTIIDQVFSDKQMAVDHAIGMNDAAKRVSLDIEHRIVEKELIEKIKVSSHESNQQGANSGQLQQHDVGQRSEQLPCSNCGRPLKEHSKDSKLCPDRMKNFEQGN